MSRWRITTIGACLLAAAGLWVWAWQREAVATDLPFSAVVVLAAMVLIAALASDEPRGRRLQVVAALALIASVGAVQVLRLVMSPEAWALADRPGKPDGAAMLRAVAEAVVALVTLRWVPGVSQPPSAALVLGLPVCLLTLVMVQVHAEVWRWGRWCAGGALALWALALLMALGMLVERKLGPPWWVLLVLVLGLLPAFRSALAAWAFGLWLLALCTLVFGGLGRWLPLLPLRDHVVAAAIVCTVLAWTAGLAAVLARRDATAGTGRDAAPAGGFPLQQHLDSPAAQEGADKYTRE